MFDKFYNDNTKYSFTIKGKKVDIYLNRIKGLKNYKNNLLKPKEFPQNYGYFIFKPKGFNSFLINEKLDILFADWDNRIFYFEKNFKTNSFTKGFSNAKFLYILPAKTIENYKISLNDVVNHRRITKKQTKKIIARNHYL